MDADRGFWGVRAGNRTELDKQFRKVMTDAEAKSIENGQDFKYNDFIKQAVVDRYVLKTESVDRDQLKEELKNELVLELLGRLSGASVPPAPRIIEQPTQTDNQLDQAKIKEAEEKLKNQTDW